MPHTQLAAELEGLSFSVDKNSKILGSIDLSTMVELMEKHHISYSPGLAQFIIDIEQKVLENACVRIDSLPLYEDRQYLKYDEVKALLCK